MFHDLSDAELSYCYARTKALIFPSVAEGFGLPLIEALHHGSAVFASDIPIFREIGGEYCVFFDVTEPESLARLIVEHETTGRPTDRRRPEDFRWTDWTESCRSLLSKALQPAPSRRAQGGEASPGSRQDARGGSHE